MTLEEIKQAIANGVDVHAYNHRYRAVIGDDGLVHELDVYTNSTALLFPVDGKYYQCFIPRTV